MTPDQANGLGMTESAVSSLEAAESTSDGETTSDPRPWVSFILPFASARSIILALSFLVVFFDTMVSIFKGWYADNLAGFLILAMSLYMIWFERDRFRKTLSRPALAVGSLVMGFGCLLYLAGKVSCTALAQNVSMVVVFFGVIWLVGGTSHVKILALPLGYLVFMFGLLEEVLGNLSVYFQTVSAWIAAGLLTLLRMPVLLKGRYIELPHITLEVADVCSGVHHIVALLAMAIPLVYMTQRSWIGRTLLMASAFLIGIFANGLRVALIGLWTAYHKGGAVHGPQDIFYATFISIFGMALLIFISGVTAKIGRKGHRPREAKATENDPRESAASKAPLPVLLAVAILLSTFGLSFLYAPVPVSLKAPLDAFPVKIGEWTGKVEHSSPYRVEQIPADASLKRTYRDESGHQVQLFIATFASQQPGKKVVNDQFSPPKGRVEKVYVALGRERVSINRVAFNDNGLPAHVYYWFDVNGRILTDRYRTKLAHVFDAMTRRRTNASLIVVSMDDNEGAGGHTGPGIDQPFIEVLLPLTNTFLNDI